MSWAKELSGFVKHFEGKTRGRKSSLQTQSSPRSSRLLQSEHGASSRSHPNLWRWRGGRGTGFPMSTTLPRPQRRQPMSPREPSFPWQHVAIWGTGSGCTRGCFIKKAAQEPLLQSLVMGRWEHSPGCLGEETQGHLQSKAALRGWPCAGFSSLSKQPRSFPGALTAFSWMGVFRAPDTVHISIPSAPRAFPGWSCVSPAVEMLLHPRECL